MFAKSDFVEISIPNREPDRLLPPGGAFRMVLRNPEERISGRKGLLIPMDAMHLYRRTYSNEARDSLPEPLPNFQELPDSVVEETKFGDNSFGIKWEFVELK